MRHKQRFTVEKIKQRLNIIMPLVYRGRSELPPFFYQPLAGPQVPPPLEPIMDDTTWELVRPQSYWGAWQTNFALYTTFTIPADWPEDNPIALYLPIGEAGDFSHPEALAYLDGQPYAACDRHHQEILLPAHYQDGQTHALLLHGWTGLGGSIQGATGTQLLMRPCAVVQIDQPTRDFIATARVTLETILILNENDPVRGRLLNALNDAFLLLDTREPLDEAFYASVPEAHAALNQGIAQSGPPLEVDVHAAGHAHIDVAWLWTLGQTRRKAERTFHTVLRLMEQFPQYQFTQSQPQLYEYIRQDQPALFQAIQDAVQAGRWEPIGGMWVEADCNLSGAESLARQFLLGRTFFRDHFGPDAETPVLWLPDVFGYAWNLPQLIKEAGLEYFFTIKIGWSQYNRLPYDSFWWQGLDGTKVLTHFSPTPEGGSRYASTYNAKAAPADVMGTWVNFQQKEQSQTLLMAFGYGDGGGGPTHEMLENIQEMAAFPGAPRIHHATVRQFFEALERECGRDLPVWKGELYLEYHRGTYTTQARNKRANRQSEFLLHNAEFLAAFAAIVNRQSSMVNFEYPHEPLHRAWQLLCLNQFHDIIPGSSITPVYEESLADYAEVRRIGEQVVAAALNTLAAYWNTPQLLINPTSFPQRALLFVPLAGDAAAPPHTQPVPGGYLIDPSEIPPHSIIPFQGNIFEWHTLSVSTHHLENDFLRVELNDAGDITRLYDKEHQRELLLPGAVANQFMAFEDRPGFWDAWDIEIHYDDRMWLAEPVTMRVVENGPLRATLELERTILHSRITQRVSLCHFSRRLDFDTVVDWHEKHILLKVAFPINLHASYVTCDIQWGNVERPIHRNTSWDWARFETCAHKWIDVSEGDYGVSLLNDCKYGHDVQDHAPAGAVMRLSLLRSPTMPDPTADEGRHEFRYSLLPHCGRVGTETIAQAYAVNNAPFVWEVGETWRPQERDEVAWLLQNPFAYTLLETDRENVVIETIKQAEDGDGLIVRLYESQRQRGLVTLRTGFPLQAAWRTNLLEENQAPLDVVTDYEVAFEIRPFQIITVRLQVEHLLL